VLLVLKVALLAILITFAAVMLWFLLSFLFKPIGKVFYRLYKEAKDEIVNEEKEI
jgi:uncharacterized membrane protein